MEEPSKKIEKITQDWVNEAGLEQPSTVFVNEVMNAIAAKTSSQNVYQPLLSLRGWSVVAIVFIASISLLYLFPMSELSYFEEVNLSSFLNFNNLFSRLEIPNNLAYGLGFLVLFLVQIPFLKKQLEI